MCRDQEDRGEGQRAGRPGREFWRRREGAMQVDCLHLCYNSVVPKDRSFPVAKRGGGTGGLPRSMGGRVFVALPTTPFSFPQKKQQTSEAKRRYNDVFIPVKQYSRAYCWVGSVQSVFYKPQSHLILNIPIQI